MRPLSIAALMFATACTSSEIPSPTSPDLTPLYAKPAPTSGGVVQLPTLGGPSEAFAVNDLGEIAGSSAGGSPQASFAVRWQKQGSTWTLTTIGPRISTAAAINQTGTIAGTVGDSAAVWVPARPVAILGRGAANGVSGSNTVVGWQWSVLPARAAAWTEQAGVWSMAILQPLPGDTANPHCVSVANAINDAGIIVGIAFDSNCVKQTAVAWIPKSNAAEGWEAALPLAGTTSMAQSVAYGIVGNTVVGAAWQCEQLVACPRRAYRWSLSNEAGVTGALGPLDARANSVNSAGSSAGSYVDRKMHAVIWAPDGGSYQTLAEIRTYDAHWVWGINSASSSSLRLAVGGAIDGRGGRYALVWQVP